MNKSEQKRYDTLYEKNTLALACQGKADSTIDGYSRSARRVTEYDDCCPDTLTPEDLQAYFASLVQTHSWSTVKLDRNGLTFFYKHVLGREWRYTRLPNRTLR